MGRLVDIDKVLSIPMSKRAREKVIKLDSKPAIIYDTESRWHNDTNRMEAHTLSCILLMAFRYGVNRHGTQALFRPDEHCVIEQNLDLMQDDFIRQMIEDINHEYDLWELRNKEKEPLYCSDNPHYLQPFLDKLLEEYKKRGY